MNKPSNVLNKEYWRSLNQLADNEEYRKYLENEFPEGASELNSPMKRRNFLGLMGASIALAGLAACRRPVEKIIPYVAQPEEVIPGIPNYYASTIPFGLESFGVIVESHEGHPTKIEGNKKHPSTMGASNILQQASILDLYDPDRSQNVLNGGKISTWSAFEGFWKGMHKEFSANRGKGLAVLSRSFHSPSMARAQHDFMKTFPQARWVNYEAVSDVNIYAGLKIATGRPVQPVYRLDKAKVVFALDADFLYSETDNIRNARGFADGRRLKSEKDDMNRLYVAEGIFTVTGGMADHRLRVNTSQIINLAVALVHELKSLGARSVVADQTKPVQLPEKQAVFINALAKDLIANRGKSLVLAGRRQPAEVHALVYAINNTLKNTGNAVEYYTLEDAGIPDPDEFDLLINDLMTGTVSTLAILGGNPLYDAPADAGFDLAIQIAQHTIHLGSHVDETASKCEWHLPMAHFLESWGDARALDGTLSVVQPLIEPLFGGRSALEIVQLLADGTPTRGYEIVQRNWKKVLRGNFEHSWKKLLHEGVLENSASKPVGTKMKPAEIAKALNGRSPAEVPSAHSLEINFVASPALFDGRFANNGWLQELPDSVSKLSWDNAVLMSLQTAQALGVKNEDVVLLEFEGRELAAPVWIQPGQADFSILLVLGYGRNAAGRIGSGVGFNAYRLRTVKHPDFATGLKITPTSEVYEMANTQDHNSMEGRPIVREASLEEYRKEPNFAPEMVEHPPLVSLWEEHSYEEGYQWGMVIDLNACTGCNACTIACQSENNIPIVGKEQVRNGREMHWLRMDRYFIGDIDEPEMVYQPVGCQQCENAPCEQVCPVQATVHDSEGLNVMAYNRCIGTRYCSNNCPYKVRRFNFFNYTKDLPEIVHMAQNPDVTVRSRGVMEKCTYCTQRINEGKYAAKAEGREVKDGEIVSACEQACPTNAITFGNINDPNSAVVQMKKQNRNYELLAELNVQPRTSYLAKLRNPNPELEKSS